MSGGRARARILIVEDDAEMRTLLTRLLSAEGYQTQAVATSLEALAAPDADLVLIDIALGDGGTKFNLSVWGRNLLDEQHVYRRDPSNSIPAVQSAPVTGVPNVVAIGNVGGILGDYGNFNVPRTFGVDATVKF